MKRNRGRKGKNVKGRRKRKDGRGEEMEEEYTRERARQAEIVIVKTDRQNVK